ncbi:hypothetical protein CBR_g34511 [Chara braunii]|uniref:Uncharacterized protein n=1 Tax=Chara braunii TaxID=69332 RepID=A0A388LIY0_CHABU|nr:hypothetical protein CBR_g34511 [Chara braunii]|eukprot:GBG82227.1 hypothetical protein CBR_g34511 [Chara braunii]
MGISNVVRTVEEPEQGEFWVSSVRFKEGPDPNDSLTVGVLSIGFESCEEDSDAAPVCAEKMSEESEENGADDTNLDIKISPRGEGPKVIQETWVDRTTTHEEILMIEECRDLKKTSDTQNKGAEDSDTRYELAPAFKCAKPDISYELAQLSETIKPDVSYELAQLFETLDLDMGCELAQLFEYVDPDVGYKMAHPLETVESDVSYELVQLFGTIEHDDDYDLAQLFEASEPGIDYGLTQLLETVEPDDDYELAQLFETLESDVGYDLAQLLETIDTSGNDVGYSFKSQNLVIMKDIGDFIMDRCTTVSVEGELDGNLLEGQDNEIRLSSDQEGGGNAIVEVKFIEDADHLKSTSREFKELSELREEFQVKKTIIDDNDSIKTGNWL